MKNGTNDNPSATWPGKEHRAVSSAEMVAMYNMIFWGSPDEYAVPQCHRERYSHQDKVKRSPCIFLWGFRSPGMVGPVLSSGGHGWRRSGLFFVPLFRLILVLTYSPGVRGVTPKNHVIHCDHLLPRHRFGFSFHRRPAFIPHRFYHALWLCLSWELISLAAISAWEAIRAMF
jgi:hypothetical protein